MINKSKAASLLVALFAATALAACGGNGSSSAAASSSKAASSTATSSSTAKSSSAASSSSSTAASSSSAAQSSSSTTSSSAPAVDIPTKADNFTFYFHFKASDTVKSLETWTSPYIDGVFNSWNAHPGVEMKALTGTDIYYAFVEKTAVNWATNANDLGYQLCLGYNSTSGVGESMQGVAGYTYKSDFSTLFSGTSHPVWATKGAAVPTSDLIDLRAYEFGDDSHVWTGEGNDYMTFKAQPVKPVVLSDYKIAVDLSAITAAAPSYITGYMVKGSYDGWAGSTLLEKGTGEYASKYIIKCGDVIANAQIQFCVAPVTLALSEVNDSYIFKDATFDYNDSTVTDPKDVGTFILNDDKSNGNAALTPLSADGNGATASWGKFKLQTGYTWPLAPVAMTSDVTITVSNSGTGALATGAKLYFAGNIGENQWGAAVGKDACAFTVSGDKLVYTISKSLLYVNVEVQFGLITNSNWVGKLVMADKNGALTNCAFKPAANRTYIDISADFAKIGVEDQAGTFSYHGDYLDAGKTITIDFVNSGTAALASGVTPCIPGEFDSWNNQTEMTLVTADVKWTYSFVTTAKQVELGTGLGFKITTKGAWDGALAGDGGANLALVITDATKLTATVTGDYSLLGAAGGVATVVVA